MKQRQCRIIGEATLSSLLVLGLLAPVLPAAQTVEGNTESNAKGKPATKADFFLTGKDNLISLKAKDASLKEVLEEISRRMKIDVLASIPDNQKITAEFEKLSIGEAVKRPSTNRSLLTGSQVGVSPESSAWRIRKKEEREYEEPICLSSRDTHSIL
jgi:hypothetical protein